VVLWGRERSQVRDEQLNIFERRLLVFLEIEAEPAGGEPAVAVRPSFGHAAPPENAERLYDVFRDALSALEVRVETGVFGARMQLELVNDGPVTIVLDQ
jgi:hypothetical protein